jgi:pilus assembly protein CpaC
MSLQPIKKSGLMLALSLISGGAITAPLSYSVPIVIRTQTPDAPEAKAPLQAEKITADKLKKNQVAEKTPVVSAGAEAGPEPVTEAGETPVTVALGFQKIIPLTALPSRIAIADPETAEITLLKPSKKTGRGAGILVVAKQVGTTSLLVWGQDQENPSTYTVTVTGTQILPMAAVPGLKIENKGNAVKLSGTVSNVLEYQQTKENLIKSSIGGKPIEVTDTTTIAVPRTVQVDVKVVEFSRTDSKRLGVNFSKTNGSFSFGFGQAQTVVEGFGATYNRIDPSQLLVQLTALESEGLARVLAEPSLVAQSGQSASFLAGGEIPIIVPAGGSSGAFTVQYKEFGIRLAFTPTILSDRTIALKVAPEVSDIDKANGITLGQIVVPALLTRRAETTVELGDGESFVIGGLINRNVNSRLEKFPILADLPILGGFFRSVEYDKQDKELLIIATPRFVKPRRKDAPALPLPGGTSGDTRPTWGQMFLPSSDGSLPGFSK